MVGGDVDGGGVLSKFFCGGWFAAGPVLKDEHIRGAIDGGDGDDTVCGDGGGEGGGDGGGEGGGLTLVTEPFSLVVFDALCVVERRV